MCALWNSGNQHKAKLSCWAMGLFNTAVVLSPLAKFKLWPLAFIKYATASYANHNEIFKNIPTVVIFLYEHMTYRRPILYLLKNKTLQNEFTKLMSFRFLPKSSVERRWLKIQQINCTRQMWVDNWMLTIPFVFWEVLSLKSLAKIDTSKIQPPSRSWAALIR